MQLKFTLILSFVSFGLFAQTTTNFEEFDLNANEHINESFDVEGFYSGNTFLPNNYSAMFDSYTGWSISTHSDTMTPGFTNQYSSITGSGYESNTFAVASAYSPIKVGLQNESVGEVVEGMYITNSTYAFLSMRDGDSFAKKFGGETGNDPDFFLLTIQKYLNGTLGDEVVEFYLADYRFDDNSQDYIVDDWTFINTSSLGQADSLLFSLTSSDVGDYGMNTPATFCVDNIVTFGEATSTKTPSIAASYSIFPNPTSEFLNINYEDSEKAILQLFDSSGKIVLQQSIAKGTSSFDIRHLTSGAYALRLKNVKGVSSELMVIE